MRVAFGARAALVFYRELQADANIAAIRGRNIDAEERRRAKAEKEEYDRCNPQLQLCCCSMLLACASASAGFLFDGAAAGRWQFCSGQRRRWSTSLKRCAVHRSSAQPHTSNFKPQTQNFKPQSPCDTCQFIVADTKHAFVEHVEEEVKEKKKDRDTYEVRVLCVA